jgi:hypothetical protein
MKQLLAHLGDRVCLKSHKVTNHQQVHHTIHRPNSKELITSKHMLAIHPKPKPRLRSWHPPIVANLQTISSLPFKSRVFPATKTTSTLNESNETERSSAGKIKRLVLSKEGRTKLNSYPDREFYSYPRFVTHVDDGFISTLTNLYQEMLRPDSEILDLMSSWVSHLPKQAVYKRIVGHGLNAQELARNPRLDYFFVKDLNQDQKLELESSSFDAVLCTVSVQYLQQPEKVRLICIILIYMPMSAEFAIKKPKLI